MVQQITDESGQVHEVPDEATPEQISAAFIKAPVSQNPAGDLLSKIQSENPAQSDTMINSIFPPEARQDVGEMARMASVPVMFAQPELAAPSLISPALNALTRIGQGAVGGLMFEAPNLQTHDQIKNAVLNNLKFNTFLEGLGGVVRGPAMLAELFNPVKYTENKIGQIKNEFGNAVQQQKAAYQPVMDQYGKDSVTIDPKNYLGFSNNQIKYFTPDIKKSYNSFLEEPNFQNLHNLQSQMGADAARIGANPAKINTAQTITSARNSVKDKLQGFLGQDENALNQYNRGNDITRDLVEPYRTNKVLRQISSGKVQSIAPTKLANAIQQGTEKSVGAIPQNHPLINHLADLQHRINIGNAAEGIIPTIAGGVIGEHILPGFYGAGSGALAGAGLEKYAGPKLIGLVQNPTIKNAMQKLAPYLYGAGRLYGAEKNQNQ